MDPWSLTSSAPMVSNTGNWPLAKRAPEIWYQNQSKSQHLYIYSILLPHIIYNILVDELVLIYLYILFIYYHFYNGWRSIYHQFEKVHQRYRRKKGVLTFFSHVVLPDFQGDFCMVLDMGFSDLKGHMFLFLPTESSTGKSQVEFSVGPRWGT